MAAPNKLSPRAMAERAPSPPETLVDALQDRIHKDGGAVRPAKTLRPGMLTNYTLMALGILKNEAASRG